MALTQSETQVTWSAASSVSVSASGNQTSDAMAVNAAAFQATIGLKADNDGTPASGDAVDFYLLPALGDPDGAGTVEYATPEHGIFLGQLDTNLEDPAIHVPPDSLPMPLTNFKVYAKNNSSGRAITVSACLLEQRG